MSLLTWFLGACVVVAIVLAGAEWWQGMKHDKEFWEFLNKR